MELIYFWIEKYKNIENQGFNISPKFKCEYNFETNELKIEENENYLKNLFPHNIDVKAIVGKNGSGKSNFVKALFQLIYLNYFKSEDFLPLYEGQTDSFPSFFFKIMSSEEKFFLIIKKNENIYKIDSEFCKKKLKKNSINTNKTNYKEFNVIYNKIKVENFESNKLNNFSIYYNYSLDSWQDEKSEWIETIYHRKDDYKIPLLLEPYKRENIIDLNLLKDLTNQRILLFYLFLKEKLINQKITSFFNPDKIKFDYAISKIVDEKILRKITITKANFLPYKLIIKYINLFQNDKFSIKKTVNSAMINTKNFTPSNSIKLEIEKFYKNDDYKSLNLLYLLFKMIEKKEKLISFYSQIISFEKTLKKISTKNELNKLIDDFEKFINNYKKTLSNLDKNDYKIKKIVVALNFHYERLYLQLSKYNNKEIQIKKLSNTNDIIDSFPGWIKVDFYENNKALSSLSTGEKFKFQFLIGFLYQLSNLSTEEYTSINIFMDEIEMGFHPEWQKNFLNEIFYALKNFKNITKFNKNINLYFLTHSPFLVSDLPKQNIIFLDKDENGMCKVVEELKEKKETFGANIHTLLSDSFFMEDGFIGKFAEYEINQVIKYLNGKKSEIKTDEEAQKIINIIGEPIIKRELQRMLDSKRLKKVNEIDAIKKEIELLQKKLEALENEKNNHN